MRISDFLNAPAISLHYTEAASNRIPYLGEGLFPARKKVGLDLKQIRAHKGLAVSLMPSNFDAKSKLRPREGFKLDETEMAFFRESMLIKERDEQDIMRVQEANDPYAMEVISRVFDDVDTLVTGADVVPERMRMQLLAPTVDGSPRIIIEADGVQYSYNYDPDESYKENNYTELSDDTDKWTDHEHSDPMGDVSAALDAVEAATGTLPDMMLVSKATMNHLKLNANIRSAVLAQNVTANIFMTDARVNEIFQNELGVTIVVYSKKYRDEDGNPAAFYPDGYATLIPSDSPLGMTWYGTTPEERTLMASPCANVSIVNTGVAVAVTITDDPVNTKTTVSEIVLPSYERMDETYVIKAY